MPLTPNLTVNGLLTTAPSAVSMNETDAACAICGKKLADNKAAENSTEKMRDFIFLSLG